MVCPCLGPSIFCSWANAKEGSRKKIDNIEEMKSFMLNIFFNKGVKNKITPVVILKLTVSIILFLKVLRGVDFRGVTIPLD